MFAPFPACLEDYDMVEQMGLTNILSVCRADRASSPPTSWSPLDIKLCTAHLAFWMLLLTLCSAVPFSVFAPKCVLQEDFVISLS